MRFRQPTQREWLTEDIRQIRRFFPGATLINTLDTPFDIRVPQRTRRQHSHSERAALATPKSLPQHVSANKVTLPTEERPVSLPIS